MAYGITGMGQVEYLELIQIQILLNILVSKSHLIIKQQTVQLLIGIELMGTCFLQDLKAQLQVRMKQIII